MLHVRIFRTITSAVLFSLLLAEVSRAVLPQLGTGGCTGDCNSGGAVTVDEILTQVNIALGNALVSACTTGDANADGDITVDEILAAVNNVLQGCSALPSPTPTATPDSGSVDQALTGAWRILSETVYFDAGGSHSITPVTTRLQLNANGRWQFGSSLGTWAVATINPADWERWGVSPYGPERKLVLYNWNGDTWDDGPIEESAAVVDYLWIIYHVDQPDPGTIWMKFGAAS